MNKICRLIKYNIVSLMLLVISDMGFSQTPIQNQFKTVDLNLRNKVAQMLIIDLRYFCDPPSEGNCQQAITTLPPELELMLKKARVGGVILYSENLQSSEQIVRLNHQLQQAALKVDDNAQAYTDTVENPLPLYIAIDQEGGRVSRLPLDEFVPFLGNMALGASYAKYNTQLAKETAAITSENLLTLGFNLNFAPVLDVNNNPENPIINVRAYSQFPHIVSQLGQAVISTMQNKGLSAAAKHFPGHGDTFMDSHLGLPRVEHSKSVINDIDLLPFREVINNPSSTPDMIMTAHIQYPGLDDTAFTSEENIPKSPEDEKVMANAVLPATLSSKILTGVLRDELSYDGLIITDALDMVSISKFLSPSEAVVKSFHAGANITLMPYAINSPQDAVSFLDWLNRLTISISQNQELSEKVETSFEKIVAHKRKRKIALYAKLELAKKLEKLNKLNIDKAKQLAQKVSVASFTHIKNLAKPLSPTASIMAVMPDKRRCQALTEAWHKQVKSNTRNDQLQCFSILSDTLPLDADRFEQIDALIVGDVFPQPSFYESREFEGIDANQRKDWEKQYLEINALVSEANSKNIPSILLKLRSPYLSEQERNQYSAIYASYDYQVAELTTRDMDEQVAGKALFAPSFTTFVDVLTKGIRGEGVLPVEANK